MKNLYVFLFSLCLYSSNLFCMEDEFLQCEQARVIEIKNKGILKYSLPEYFYEHKVLQFFEMLRSLEIQNNFDIKVTMNVFVKNLLLKSFYIDRENGSAKILDAHKNLWFFNPQKFSVILKKLEPAKNVLESVYEPIKRLFANMVIENSIFGVTYLVGCCCDELNEFVLIHEDFLNLEIINTSQANDKIKLYFKQFSDDSLMDILDVISVIEADIFANKILEKLGK